MVFHTKKTLKLEKKRNYCLMKAKQWEDKASDLGKELEDELEKLRGL